jgi:uncharacterized protein (TIGR03083 family)
MLQAPGPILVVELFPIERAALLDLLQSLDPPAWERETVCPGWAVRDIAAHLVADDFGRLSRVRDNYRPDRRDAGEDVVSFVNRQNEEWVRAMRGISPTVLTTLLDVGGRETQKHFETLDPFAYGGSVFWATGDEPAPIWLDIARELTERWQHQEQVRDAVGAPSLTDPRILRPVLATFAHALPRTFRAVERPEGTTVTMMVTGESGNTWSIVREGDAWQFYLGRRATTSAEVELTQDIFWRVVTKGITPALAEDQARLVGDLDLARHLLTTTAIIA